MSQARVPIDRSQYLEDLTRAAVALSAATGVSVKEATDTMMHIAIAAPSTWPNPPEKFLKLTIHQWALLVALLCFWLVIGITVQTGLW